MTSGTATESFTGFVKRVASDPQESKSGGYVFRGIEFAVSGTEARVFLIIPEELKTAGRTDLYEFPFLCWEGAEVAIFDVAVNNRLEDGSIIYCAGPETALVLEPRRPVSVTDAVEAVDCIRAVDARYRVAHGEPFYMAKGRLIHSLFDRLFERDGKWSRETCDRAFAEALPALRELLLGSAMKVDEKALKQDAREHFMNLADWVRTEVAPASVDLEVDRISTRWGLKGRTDARVRLGDSIRLVELKTGAVPVQSHHLQLSAYSLLFQEGDGRCPDGWLVYSASGKAEHMKPAPWHLLLNGRNRVVALRRSYTLPSSVPDMDVLSEPCRKRRCLFRPQCEVLSSGAGGDAPPLLQGPARALYDHWFRLISIDLWETESEFARVLDPSTLTDRLEEGRTVPIADMMVRDSCLPEENRFADSGPTGNGDAASLVEADLITDGRMSEASVGERVILHRGDPSTKDAYWGIVSEMGDGRIRVRVAASAPVERAFADSSGKGRSGWFIDRPPFTRPREVSRHALLNFFLNADPAVIQTVISENHLRPECLDPLGPQEGESISSKVPRVTLLSDEELLFSEGLKCELNDEQETAIKQALAADTFHLIHGPPGTGKTRVLARLVRLCLDRGERPLLACPTNVALDRLLYALMDLGVTDLVRIGGRHVVADRFDDSAGPPKRRPRLLADLARSSRTFAAFQKKVRQTKLIAATAYQCAAHPLFIRERFDTVVIDEAGQLDEPSCLGVIGLGKKFVLCGDHLQLPPVVQGRSTDGSPGLEMSLLERLFGCADQSRITRLKVQYRMNREIQDIPSRLFYNGSLVASPEAAARRLRLQSVFAEDSEVSRIIDPLKPAVFVHVDGSLGGKARPQEAAVVARIVKGLLRAGVPEREIGIITPYRVQQQLIRQHLHAVRATASVDTVDRFQGGEREVIILSLARSDSVTSFLADKKRLNVSLSRARSKLILTGHGAVLEGHPLFESLLTGLDRISVTS